MMLNGTGFVRGNLAGDATVYEQGEGKYMTVFTVMRSRSKKERTTGEWVQLDPHPYDIVVFDTLANRAAKLKKGDRVTVEYDHSPTFYETKDNPPQKIRTWSFVAKDIEYSKLLPRASVLSQIQSEQQHNSEL